MRPRLRRLVTIAAAAAVVTAVAVQPASAAVRTAVTGHVVLRSDPQTGVPSFTVSGAFATSFDCELEQGGVGDGGVAVLCTPKAALTGIVWYCGPLGVTVTVSSRASAYLSIPSTGGVIDVDGPPRSLAVDTRAAAQGASRCKDAGEVVTPLASTDPGQPRTAAAAGSADSATDVWAVRCVAFGPGPNGSPLPDYTVDCAFPAPAPPPPPT